MPAGTDPTPISSGGGESVANQSRWTGLAVPLIVVPLAVVLCCVTVGGLFIWLTAEHKDFDDYLTALRSSRGERQTQQAQFLLHYIEESKRWQGIFDVTARISAAPEQFRVKNPGAIPQLIQVFEESPTESPKTRRYLALVLGLLGDPQAIPALRRGLDDGDPETIKNCLWALGHLNDQDSALRAVELAHHEESSVRLMAVYVLGSMTHPLAAATLTAALNDPDDLVRWNAAFGLAHRGDPAGRAVLVQLLDKGYVDRFTGVTAPNRQRYRMAAVTFLANLDREKAKPLLEKVGATDPDLQVRNAALQQLKKFTNHPT